MKKLASLQRRCAVFGGAIVVLAVVLVFRPAETSTQRSEDLPALLQGFSSEGARELTLVQGGSLMTAGKERRVALSLRERRDGSFQWVVSSAFGYPADEAKVARLLSELANAKVVGEATRRTEAFEQYVEDGAWVEVEVKGAAQAGNAQAGGEDAGSGVLARVGLGKAQGQETYVLADRGGPQQRVLRVRNLASASVKAVPEAWLDARMFPNVESRHVEALEILQKTEVDGKPATRKLSFVKEAQEAAKEGEPPAERRWQMLSPETGPASRVDVEDLARALVGLIFQDVVDQPETGDGDPKYGFAAPEIVATATFATADPSKAPQKISLTLGALDAEKKVWYARRGGSTWVFTVTDNDYSTGRLRNDPSKFKETPPPAEKPADKPGEKPADAPKDGAGGIGDPDGGAGPEEAPKPPQPPEPAPETPKPPEPVPSDPPPAPPGDPKPGDPKPPEPPKPEEPGAPK